MAPEITGKYTEIRDQRERLPIDLKNSEVELSNQNKALGDEIGHLKNHFCHKMVSTKFPRNLWGYPLVSRVLVTSDSFSFEMCKVSIKSNLDLHMRSHIRKLLSSDIVCWGFIY